MNIFAKKLPSPIAVENTIAALRNNNIEAFLVQNKEEARRKVIELLPEKAEVMDMRSATLEECGITQEIQASEDLISIRNGIIKMDPLSEAREIRHLGAAADWAVGSVHAITEDGHVLITSTTGSQLSAYAFGSERVIWVAGVQKIVKNFDEAMRRVYEREMPVSSDWAKKGHQHQSGNTNKILIFNRENQPGRVTLILVNEVLGH